MSEIRHPAEWPGNVRELKSAVQYAVIGCKGSVVQEDDLPPEVHPSLGDLVEPVAAGSATDEKTRLQQALDRAGGNRAKAARLLGISRATFYRRLADLNIPSREK